MTNRQRSQSVTSARVIKLRWLPVRLLGLIVFLLMMTPTTWAQNKDPVQEFQLKAALIYNFAQFIDWPDTAFAHPQSPFSICIMGDNPFGEAINALKKRTYKSRPIEILYPETIVAARLCHILYVDEPSGTSLGPNLKNALKDASVLTISSDADAMTAGIGIGFVRKGANTRWTLNLTATRHAQLKVSAKLIEIAVGVIDDTAH